MEKKGFYVLFVLGLLILTSCNGRVNEDGERISDHDYRKGNQGLELNFLKNSPPDRIYSGNPMDIIVDVRNVGAYPNTDSFDGKLVVYGFDEQAMLGEGWDNSNFISSTLQGRSQFAPQGGRENKRYHIDRVTTPFGSEFYEPTIVAAACYKYRTIAEPLVCIDPEPFTVFDEQKVCSIDQNGETYGLSTQGAPVAVTRVIEEVTSKNVLFTIYVRNVGKGKVVDENARNDCPLELDYNDIDKIIVRAKLQYDANPICQPRGDYRDPLRLDESGNGVIFCTFQKPASKSAFETVLQIQLDYRYLDSIEKKVRIINLDR